LSKIRKVSVEKDFILAMLNWFLHLIYLKKINVHRHFIGQYNFILNL
jgi:hypothetical protein